MPSDGAIIVDTGIDNSGFIRDARQFKGTVEGLKNSVNQAGQSMGKGMGAYTKAMKGAADGSKAVARDQAAIQKEIAKTEQALERLQAKQDLARKKWEAAQENAIADAAEKFEKNNAGLEAMPWEDATQAAEAYAEDLNHAIQQAMEKFGSFEDTAAFRNTSVETEFLTDRLAKLREELEQAANSEDKASASGNSLKDSFEAVAKSAGKMQNVITLKNILALGIGVSSLTALFSKLRGAIKEGLGELAKRSPSLRAALGSLQGALNGLRGSLATAFSPIFTSIAPALTTLINMLATAVTYIGMFMAALTGQGFYTVAKGVGAVGSAAKSAGGAVKDLKRQLAGFDELEILSDSSSGGGGGGGGGGASFETEEKPLEGFLKGLSDFMSGLPDWLKWLFAGTALVGGFLLLKKFLPWLINKIKDLFKIKLPNWMKWLFSPKSDKNIKVKVDLDAPESVEIPVKANLENSARDLYNKLKSEWLALGSRTLYAAVKLDNTAKVLFDNLKREWNSIGSRVLYCSPKLDNTAGVLWSNFKGAWDAIGSKVLYLSPKLDNTASVLWNNFKSSWDSLGSKTLYLSPKLDNTASVPYNAFKSEWEKMNHLLYFSPKLDNTAQTLYNTFKTAWDAAGSKVLYFSPKLDNTASALWNSFKNAWNSIGSLVLYMSPKLDNTASVLWNTFKTAWDNLTRTLYASPKLDNTASALWTTFKNAWNSITSKTLYMSPKLDNTAAAIWNSFKIAWNNAIEPLTVTVNVVYNDAGNGGNTSGGAPNGGNVPVNITPIWSPTTGGGGSTSGGGAGRSKPTVAQWVEENYGGGSVVKPVLLKNGFGGNTILGWLFKNWWGGNVEKPVYLKNGFGGKTILGWLFKNWWGGNVEKGVYLKNAFGGNTILGWLYKNWWGGNVEKGVGLFSNFGKSVQAWLQPLMGGNTQAPVDLKQTWVGKPKPVLHLAEKDLATSSTVNLFKGWSGSALKALDLNNLTAEIKAKLVMDRHADEVKVTFSNKDMTYRAVAKALGGIITAGGRSLSFASGGMIRGGVSKFFGGIPQYASGTARAHGTMFIAGEAGPEIVGHIGGRTEILNKSQLAQTMYAATENGMLAAMKRVEFRLPAMATGTVMPYDVSAQIARSTTDIQNTLDANNEDLIQTIISVIGAQTAAIVGALNASRQQSGAGGMSAQDIINEINRRTQMFSASPLAGV